MKLTLLGAPSAGKSTQANHICEKFCIPRISVGDISHAAFRTGSSNGLTARAITDAGGMLSDDIIIDMLKERIQETDCANGFVLDDFPRTMHQAEAMRQAGIHMDYVVELDVGDDEIIQRISGRRSHLASGRTYHILLNPSRISGKDDITGEELAQHPDDSEQMVSERLHLYREQTKQLTNYYTTWAKIGDSDAPRYIIISSAGGIIDTRNKILAMLLIKRFNMNTQSV